MVFPAERVSRKKIAKKSNRQCFKCRQLVTLVLAKNI